jgi:hypothetical protein
LNQQPCAPDANALPLSYAGFSLFCKNNVTKIETNEEKKNLITKLPPTLEDS